MLFPNAFRPTDLKGPRARQFASRSDLFQQLVGDALREKFGSRATVFPTLSNDGGIDAFVEKADGANLALADLPAPQIIECKDHDDTRPGLVQNIQAAWANVADKLRKQARLGWPGSFDPWRRANSYAYCVSAVLGKLNVRDTLQTRITDWFNGLPAHERPPISGVRVLDYGDLCHLFNSLSRLCDQWLGIAFPAIVGHAEYCESLTSFRSYLLTGNLPFVVPEADTIRPQAIWNKLERMEGPSGVLIKGIGGVGKTRTCLEIGHLADAAGWRVVHCLPSEIGTTVNDLAEVVLSGATPTLLIFDYLDQMPKLDLGALRRQLLPAADKRGLRLRVLANLRPSSLRRANPERDVLFPDQVLLSPSAHQRSVVAEKAVDVIAPGAVARIGHDRVRALCGERPIIAMFIAAELERRARANEPVDTGFRGGDLLAWLSRRLAEDGLVVSGPNGILPLQPDHSLIAAASILAAAPLSRSEMDTVALRAQHSASSEALVTAAPVEGLLKMGWLEVRQTELFAAHDVVADEVLAGVLWDRVDDALRTNVLDHVLAPALGSARVLGRYATALTRQLGPATAETPKEAGLRLAAKSWLRGHAPSLGQTLTHADVGESAYALGAVVSSPAWQSALVSEWDQLVAPWLKAHGSHLETRHLLYMGLKELPPGAAGAVITVALEWSAGHLTVNETSYVLGPLLGRRDLGGFADRAVQLAMAWLEKFPLVLESQFLLNPLLARPDLGGFAARAIEFAMAWLEKFPLVLDTGFVLPPLLARPDLRGFAARAVQLAMAWLEKFPLVLEAQFLFNPLLARRDLGGFAARAIELAMAWLEKFPLVLDTGFVLPPLLDRRDLAGHSDKAVQFAMAWLEDENFRLLRDAEFILKRLLAGRYLTQDQRTECLRLSLLHLKQYGSKPEASHLLKACLKCCEDNRGLETALEDAVVRIGMEWLADNSLQLEADYVFNRILKRDDLMPADWEAVAEKTLAWLRRHNTPKARDLSLCGLLSRPQQLGAELSFVLDQAFEWLAQLPENARAPCKLIRALYQLERSQSPDVQRFSPWFENWRACIEDLLANAPAAVEG